MLATARKLGVAPKAPKRIEVVPRCLEHAFEELGFSTPWDLAFYLDELARRTPRKGSNVRLPPEKTPGGVRVAIGIRCRHCKGRGCYRCAMHGWGILYRVAIKKREHKCVPREAAPATPATAAPTAPATPAQGITGATVGASSAEP